MIFKFDIQFNEPVKGIFFQVTTFLCTVATDSPSA